VARSSRIDALLRRQKDLICVTAEAAQAPPVAQLDEVPAAQEHTVIIRALLKLEEAAP
jgi:hypothetical protein